MSSSFPRKLWQDNEGLQSEALVTASVLASGEKKEKETCPIHVQLEGEGTHWTDAQQRTTAQWKWRDVQTSQVVKDRIWG